MNRRVGGNEGTYPPALPKLVLSLSKDGKGACRFMVLLKTLTMD